MTLAAIDSDLNRIAEMLEQSSDVLVISGAGMSTASASRIIAIARVSPGSVPSRFSIKHLFNTCIGGSVIGREVSSAIQRLLRRNLMMGTGLWSP